MYRDIQGLRRGLYELHVEISRVIPKLWFLQLTLPTQVRTPTPRGLRVKGVV